MKIPLSRATVFLALLSISPLSHAAPAKFGAVSVGGVSIRGLDQTGATRRVRRELAPRLEKRVGLVLGRKIAYRARRDLGFSLDVGQMLGQAAKGKKRVPVAFLVDQKAMSRALSRVGQSLSNAPRDARPVLVGKRVQIRPEIVGRVVNASQSAAKIKNEAEKRASQVRFQLAASTRAPRLTRARLKGINAVLGTFTTRFNPSNIKRTRNMRIAIGSIDGTLLSRGEVFSLNQTVGERTQARGYRTATIFQNGKKEPGIGGGVSQVTGTIFNAALVAGLSIVSYRTHSRPVAYLPIGRDATVAWNSFDMTFKNDTAGPIFVSYRLAGSSASATVFGRRTGRRVSLRVVSKKNGPRDIDAVLFRTIRQNGKVVKKEKVGNSSYNWKEDNED